MEAYALLESWWRWVVLEGINVVGTRCIFAVCLLFGLLESAFSECHVPSYRDGLILADKQSETMMNISIPLSDFAPEKLRCLANALHRRFQDRKIITVFVLSSHKVAKNWIYQTIEPPPESVVENATVHAIYRYNSEKKEDFIALMPYLDLSMEGRFSTRIERQSEGEIHCKVELADRCLLARQDISYPGGPQRVGQSGRVSLSGVIRPDGKVQNVQVLGESSEANAAFAKEAAENFSTWVFERANRSDRVEIMYRYEMVDMSTHSTVEFKPPNEVLVSEHVLR